MNLHCIAQRMLLRPACVLGKGARLMPAARIRNAFYDIHPIHHLYGGENAFLLAEYEAAIREAGFTGLQTISPWHSAINFAPYTPATLQQAIAGKYGGMAPLVKGLFRIPGVWPMTRALIAMTDRRLCRLYSFVASKLAV